MRIPWIAAALLAPVIAHAGEGCDGLWKGHYVDSARAREAQVDMTVQGDTGVWIAHLGAGQKAKNSPCRDREFPVRVVECTQSKFVFRVDGNSVLRGCPRFTAHLVRRDADHADGSKGGQGNALEMVRGR